MSSGIREYGPTIFKDFIGKPIRLLEIGVYDGRSAVWFLENLLTHPNSDYLGVDLVTGHEEAHLRAKANLEVFRPKVTLVKADSMEYLPRLYRWDNKYDIVHIDGDHGFTTCVSDLSYSWNLLNPNGIVLLDDYHRDDYEVYKAVHTFLASQQPSKYEIVHLGYMIAFKKLPSATVFNNDYTGA